MMFGPSDRAGIRAISLGAGVQSTTLLLMADAGEILPRPDVAIFSDRGWEPKSVYDNLERLKRECSIDIVTVSAGNIQTDSVEKSEKRGFVTLPMFSSVGGGMMRRQCTKDYKIFPVRNHLKEMYPGTGRIPEGWACLWIGISYDEVQRMKDANVKWIDHRWPLVEKQMTRADCMEWLKAAGWGDVPKSSCIGCPFHDDKTWARMRRDDPGSFAEAVSFDEKMRNIGKMDAEAYLHKSLRPLSDVEFGDPDDGDDQLFINECEGFCGL